LDLDLAERKGPGLYSIADLIPEEEKFSLERYTRKSLTETLVSLVIGADGKLKQNAYISESSQPLFEKVDTSQGAPIAPLIEITVSIYGKPAAVPEARTTPHKPPSDFSI